MARYSRVSGTTKIRHDVAYLKRDTEGVAFMERLSIILEEWWAVTVQHEQDEIGRTQSLRHFGAGCAALISTDCVVPARSWLRYHQYCFGVQCVGLPAPEGHRRLIGGVLRQVPTGADRSKTSDAPCAVSQFSPAYDASADRSIDLIHIV